MTYDCLDRLATETYPDGEIVSYTYNIDENLEEVYNDSSYYYVSDIDYESTGRVKRMALGNSTAINYGYDADSYRLTSIYADTTTKFNLSYQYDDAGNIVTRKDHNYSYQTAGGFTEEYTYDAFYRLTQAVSPTQLYGTKSYAYNKLNNITQRQEAQASR